MWQIVGLIGVFAAVGGGYALSGGKFAVILNSIGPELLTILGSGCMTLLISNELVTIRKILMGMKKIFAYRQKRTLELLAMMTGGGSNR